MVILGGLALSFVAAATAAQRSPQEILQELKERARTAKPEDATLANARVVEREIMMADEYFRQDEVDKGLAAVKEAMEYAEQVQAAVHNKGRHLKQTEVILRVAARRLEDIRRTLALEDQPPLQKAEDRLDEIRRDLLTQMFGPKK